VKIPSGLPSQLPFGPQDIAGEHKARPAVRRVGMPALMDGSVGEQILEGAGARFVGLRRPGQQV